MKIKLWKIVEILLISSVLGVGISYSKIYLFHIILFLFIFFLIYLVSKNNFKLLLCKPSTNLHKFLYIMFFWYFLSVLWSNNKFYAFEYLFYLINGIGISLIMIYFINTIEKQIRIFKILSYTFLFEALICILEIFTPFRWPISPFSKYVYYFNREPGADLDAPYMELLSHMPTGFQWNPNNLAVTFLILLPFVLNHKKRKIQFIGTLVILSIIFFTDSRGVLFSSLVLIFLWAFLNFKRILKSFFIYIFIIFILFIPFKDEIFQKLEETINVVYLYIQFEGNRKDSIGIREELIKIGWESLKNTYYLGVGAGNSKTAAEKSNNPIIKDIKSMHNFWMEMLVESGAFFTALFFIWYFYIVYKLYIVSKKSNHPYVKYFANSTYLSMISFIPGAITASSVIYLLPMWLMYGFALVTINNYYKIRRNKQCTS